MVSSAAKSRLSDETSPKRSETVFRYSAFVRRRRGVRSTSLAPLLQLTDELIALPAFPAAPNWPEEPPLPRAVPPGGDEPPPISAVHASVNDRHAAAAIVVRIMKGK